ncbi:odorant receptor 47a-like isoform X1 [Rhodnius prolixus]|uniref:odorant receptor 47a-like isoform X1 n=2 Tax=Rhodnius prolixus TaxID=13249 RepID=UPI003D18DD47
MEKKTNKLSPIKQAFRAIRFSGLIVEKENQWAISLTVYHILMISYGAIAVGIELCLVEENLLQFVEVLSTSLLYINDSTKALNILLHQKKIKDLFNRLDKFSLKILQDQEAGEHVKSIDKENLFAKSFRVKFISVFIPILLWLPPISLITGIIGDYLTDFVKPHLPYQLWLPWSMDEFLPYLAGMVFVTMLELTTCIFYTSFTIMFLTFTNELSACLRILQARLETNGPTDKNIYKYHNVIIDILQTYNGIFCGPLYIEILISTLQPCGFLYAFTKVFKNYNPAAFEQILKALLCVAAPYIVCSCGQEISNQMEQLHNSAYASKWYEESPRVRKDLLTMMIITTKRINLNYRMFITYNYVCLGSVFQGIYSYLTMIINLEAN